MGGGILPPPSFHDDPLEATPDPLISRRLAAAESV
jgi:hypothetical protein